MKQPEPVIRLALKATGLKATPQRLLVFDIISRTEGFFTPRELYERLKHRNIGIGIVTVYRTLTSLTRAGLVCQIESTGKTRIYARTSRTHHHHLVCRACARVLEINGCELDDMAKKLARETGFNISSHSLEFQGLCRECNSVPEALESREVCAR